MMEQLEAFDRWFVLTINGWHTPFLDELFWLISGKSSWIPLYFIVIVALVRKYSWKKMIVFLITVVVAVALSDQLATHAFKEVFLRYRPSHNLLLTNKLHFYEIKPGEFYKGGQYGFVSSHAANFAAMATLVYFFLKSNYTFLKWLLPIVVALVCISRVYLGVHYLSDVLVGALLGGLVAIILNSFVRKFFPNWFKL